MRIFAISALAVLCVGCAQRVPCNSCGSQWNHSVAPAAWDEDDYHRGDDRRRAPVVAEDGVKYQVGARRMHSRRVRHAANQAAQQTTRSRFTTDLSAFPSVLKYDSPAVERERRESERLDKALQRTLGSVCKGC